MQRSSLTCTMRSPSRILPSLAAMLLGFTCKAHAMGPLSIGRQPYSRRPPKQLLWDQLWSRLLPTLSLSQEARSVGLRLGVEGRWDPTGRGWGSPSTTQLTVGQAYLSDVDAQVLLIIRAVADHEAQLVPVAAFVQLHLLRTGSPAHEPGMAEPSQPCLKMAPAPPLPESEPHGLW